MVKRIRTEKVENGTVTADPKLAHLNDKLNSQNDWSKLIAITIIKFNLY